MTRLPRNKKNNMFVDVTITRQNNLPRVRLSLGEDTSTRRNTDMAPNEVENLIVILQYKLALINSGEDDEGDIHDA